MLDGILQHTLCVILVLYQEVCARCGLESTSSLLWVPSPTGAEEFPITLFCCLKRCPVELEFYPRTKMKNAWIISVLGYTWILPSKEIASPRI